MQTTTNVPQDAPAARRLPAEWEPVGAVLLAWPSEDSDWAPYLERARTAVVAMAKAIGVRSRVIIVSDDAASTQAMCAAAAVANLTVVEVPLNDTWIRDYGPITVLDGSVPRLLDFGFNGWGLKFAACNDNQVTARLHEAGHLGEGLREVPGMWLEGGSIESDGAGTILTTTSCQLSPNRNPHLDQDAIDEELKRHFGATQILWLENGHLEGDDTDSHIDTIARICPNDTIAYVRCDDPADSHFADFAAMEAELKAMRTRDGNPFRLVPLPWSKPCYAEDDGRRLPATYANFLIVNGAVLVPTYGDAARDAAALKAVGEACPGFEIVGIDCRILVEQHGSLHCMTMQVPKAVWG
jgi:agmatine deiminase